MKFKLEYINCPLCGSSEKSYLYKKPDARFFLSPIEFNVVKCKNCSVGYVNPRPSIEEIKHFYCDEYFNTQRRSLNNKFNLKRYPRQASYFKDLPKGSKILDIGCATGSFVKFLSENLEMDAYGMDFIKPKTIDYDISKFKFGLLDEFNYPDNFFDGICAWAVFEHLHKPMRYFSWVSRVLKKGGKFVFLTSHLNSLLSRFAYGEDIPRHLIFYTRKSLQFCSQQTGLKLKKIEYTNKIYSGAGFGVFQKQFLIIGGANWKQISGYQPLPPLISILSKLLLGIGRILIPPTVETLLKISGVIIVTMIKPSTNS
jgi:ubiquinone/menaquinone biosynthesis C-methylase UbiE